MAQWVSIEKASKILEMSKDTLYAKITQHKKKGDIVWYKKVGRFVYLDVSYLEDRKQINNCKMSDFLKLLYDIDTLNKYQTTHSLCKQLEIQDTDFRKLYRYASMRQNKYDTLREKVDKLIEEYIPKNS